MQEDSVASSLSNISFSMNVNSGGIADPFQNSLKPLEYVPSQMCIKNTKKQEQIDYNQLLFSPHHSQNIQNQRQILEQCWNFKSPFSDHQDLPQEKSKELTKVWEVAPSAKSNQKQNSLQLNIQLPKQKPGRKRCQGKQRNRLKTSQEKKTKNQTKNIPKNFGKAIISYIEKEGISIKSLAEERNICYEEFLSQLLSRKKEINTIANLRELWVQFDYAQCMRRASNQFLRKHALSYIFNSRINNYKSHVKYQRRLREAIEDPNDFKHIKEY